MNIGGDFLVHAKKGTQAGSTTRGLGDLTWTTSIDHTSNVSHYEGRIQAENSATTIKTLYLGKPGSGDSVSVRINIAGALNALAAGNYNVVVVAVNGDGASTEVESNTFTVPLFPE